VRAVPPPPESEATTAVLVIADPIAEGDAAKLCERLQAVAQASGAEVIACDVRALSADCRSVDALARLQLTARRLGRRLRLHRASHELEALLSFVGLAEVVGGAGTAGLCVERRGRQVKEREEPRGVEERVDRDDAPA
jgi:ABC-type transporter Mla MlaB component